MVPHERRKIVLSLPYILKIMSHLLWPHKTVLQTYVTNIQNWKVADYFSDGVVFRAYRNHFNTTEWNVKRTVPCTQLFPDASLVKASAPESRSAMQVAPLEIWIAEGPAMDMLLLLPAVNYSSSLSVKVSPPPFPSAISPQSCTADHWKVLILKFTQTPNTFGTIV